MMYSRAVNTCLSNRLFLVLSFICVQVVCVAQDRYGKGYYVTPQHDTVHGYVRYRENFLNTIPFRKDLDSPEQDVQAIDAVAFGFDGGVHYELMNFPVDGKDNMVFARKVVEGNVNLYMFYAQYKVGSDSKKYFILSKTRGGGTPNERMAAHQKKVGAVNVLFSDCAQVAAKGENLVVQEEPLVEIISEYHRCKSEPFKVYVAEKRRRAALGVFASYNVSSLAFSGSDESLNRTTYDNSSSPGIGAILLITPSRKHSSIFSLQMELAYHQMKFSGNSYYEKSAAGYDFKYTSVSSFDLQKLAAKFGFRLTGRSNVINPYLSAGIAISGLLPSSSEFVKDVQINDATETYRSEPVTSVEPGVWVSAGVKKRLKQRGAIFADIGFEAAGVAEGGKIKIVTPRIGYIF